MCRYDHWHWLMSSDGMCHPALHGSHKLLMRCNRDFCFIYNLGSRCWWWGWRESRGEPRHYDYPLLDAWHTSDRVQPGLRRIEPLVVYVSLIRVKHLRITLSHHHKYCLYKYKNNDTG